MDRAFPFTLFVLVPYAPAAMADAESDGTTLHTGYDHDSCYLDLHPELTQRTLGQFGREFMDAGAFLAMAGADPLGAGHVQIGLTYDQTFIDDATPQWNDTFSHPGEDHWLGRPAIPMLQGRVGVAAAWDAELLVTGDPSSNWALLGGGVRRAILRESEVVPVSLSGRLTYEHLLGPAEVQVEGTAAEALVSHRFGHWTPYASVALTASLGRERTDELSLDPAWAMGPRAALGSELAFGKLRIAAQGLWSSVPSVALNVGGAF
jgi:hypothetical protein